MHPEPQALTFDLDDTLWPIWPVIERAETVLHAWLVVHAPATAARFDRAALRGLRDGVARERPDWLHDLSAIRHESLRRALQLSGDDPALGAAAFGVFFDARQHVVLFDDALEALERLAARFPLMALTNGNADLGKIGLAGFFRGSISAKGLGVAKPDARIFHHACTELGCRPDRVLHVGDDFHLDVAGALGAGLQAAWLRRDASVQAPLDVAVSGGASGHVDHVGWGSYRVFADLIALADELVPA